MNGLTTIKRLISHKRLKPMLMMFAIAAFISLAALPTPAQTPTQVGDHIFLTGNTVEVTTGSTIRVHYDTGFGNRIAIRGSAKVFSGTTGALLQSQELSSPTAGVYSIEINRDDLREAGEPDTGRLQLWIVVAFNSDSASPGTDESGVWVLRSTFELIDNQSGRPISNQRVWHATNFQINIDGIPSEN